MDHERIAAPLPADRPAARSGATTLRVLVVGAGARDHALCAAFRRSALLGELHAVPGNAGIAGIATCHPDIGLQDIDRIVELAVRLDIDLAIVGPEDLLVAGLSSRLADVGGLALGPTRAAAQLEGSKMFAKQLMADLGLPTPEWRSCTDLTSAEAAIDELGGAVAVKADGLAAGCGAFVCPSREDAEAALQALMVDRMFGASGDRVLVEQLVTGREVSVMAITDGSTVLALPAARDYKRLLDGDAGPNTGGMGAHAPSGDIDEVATRELVEHMVQPVVDELRRRGAPYRGVVYAGVMLTSDGPQLLEFNCRLGNPETQALVRVLDTDLLDLLHRAATGDLDEGRIREPLSALGSAVAVCVSAPSYPREQFEAAPIRVRGLHAAAAVEGVDLFIGMSDGRWTPTVDEINSAGGRTLTVSAWGETMELAIERAYDAVGHIQLAGGHFRRDIGQPALARA